MMLSLEDQSIISKPLQFLHGFVAGSVAFLTNPTLGFWVTPLVILLAEARLVRDVWMTHTLPMTRPDAIEKMILIALPYVAVLLLLRTLKRICVENHIGADVYAKLRGVAFGIVWCSYMCLLAALP